LIAKFERMAHRVLELADQKRRPFFVEFAGSPKSGKTTALNALQLFLKRNGVNTRVYQERASVAPLSNKGTAAFNIWVTCATLSGMIEALEDEKLDVLILDRGLFDGLVWIDWQERTRRLTPSEADTFRKFVLTPRWWGLVDILFVMHCQPRVSIEREYANQLTERSGAIMNGETLKQLRSHLLGAVGRYKDHLKEVWTVDTTKAEQMEVLKLIATRTLRAMEYFADEEVLCVPKAELAHRFKLPEKKLMKPNWDRFKALIEEKGEYVRRSRAESRDEWMQIVPVCVIGHKGRYLTNLRYEPSESLHDTLANWAGGHVRKQDLAGSSSKWDSVLAGLSREILEELAIAELPAPRPLGLVHTSEDPRAARHLGVVFQVELDDPATAATLENKTIKERPNKHVRTAWKSTRELGEEPGRQKDWSKSISEFLARQS
jgi:predicted NUDIX family phosphoesterase